jgi:hypothetical protein
MQRPRGRRENRVGPVYGENRAVNRIESIIRPSKRTIAPARSTRDRPRGRAGDHVSYQLIIRLRERNEEIASRVLYRTMHTCVHVCAYMSCTYVAARTYVHARDLRWIHTCDSERGRDRIAQSSRERGTNVHETCNKCG